MNPVNLFLVKNCASRADITKQGYSHLCVQKLPLFPNIVMKHSDLVKESKATSKLLLCQAGKVSKAQLDSMAVTQIILVDEPQASNIYIGENRLRLDFIFHDLSAQFQKYRELI